MTVLTQLSSSIAQAPRWYEHPVQSLDSIQISPIQGALGATVIGLNAALPQTAEVILALKKALHDHLILVFKQQQLDDGQLLAFASYFGAIFKPPVDIPVLATQSDTGVPPDVIPVSNAVGAGDYTGHGENYHRIVTITGHLSPPVALYCMHLNCQKMAVQPAGIIRFRHMKIWMMTPRMKLRACN